jgi:polysaccharide biosynthesis protein PslG
MKAFIQNNTATVLILIATLILAGVATFTAVRLYQLRVQPVSPTSPERSNAQTAELGLATPLAQSTAQQCKLTFTLTLGTPVATAAASATATGSASPKATSSGSPRATATSSATPKAVGGVPTVSPTVTPKATASASPRATTQSAIATATPVAQLPNAGSTLPTIVGIVAAVLLLVTAFALAL